MSVSLSSPHHLSLNFLAHVNLRRTRWVTRCVDMTTDWKTKVVKWRKLPSRRRWSCTVSWRRKKENRMICPQKSDDCEKKFFTLERFSFFWIFTHIGLVLIVVYRPDNYKIFPFKERKCVTRLCEIREFLGLLKCEKNSISCSRDNHCSAPTHDWQTKLYINCYIFQWHNWFLCGPQVDCGQTHTHENNFHKTGYCVLLFCLSWGYWEVQCHL